MRILFIILFIMSSNLYSNNQDVVYLKNGSVIKGAIVEIIPDKSIKIETPDGSIIVYKMDEVDKIIKEKKTKNNLPENYKSKTWSFKFGVSQSEAANDYLASYDYNDGLADGNGSLSAVLRITKDFKLNDNIVIFLYSSVFLNAYGLGVSYQTDYNNDGFVVKYSRGKYISMPLYEQKNSEWLSDSSLTLLYQKVFKSNQYWSFGINLWNYARNEDTDTSIISTDDYYGKHTSLIPIIGWDIRF